MDFSALAGDCLDAVAQARRIDLDADAREAIFTAIGRLPPHPDVMPALERLRAAGFLMALTNSAQQTVDAQFEHAGLSEHFDHVRSGPRALLQTAPGRLRRGHRHAGLCAGSCVSWRPTTGTSPAPCAPGFDGAFVAREGAVYNSAGTPPTLVGDDLAVVTDRLIAAYG